MLMKSLELALTLPLGSGPLHTLLWWTILFWLFLGSASMSLVPFCMTCFPQSMPKIWFR